MAPSMREVPLEADAATREFAERLFAGDFDMMVLLTGVGTRQLHRAGGPAIRRGVARAHVGGAWSQTGGGAARDGALGGGRGARAEHLARTADRHGRPAGEAHCGAGVRPVEPRVAGRLACARRGSDRGAGLSVGLCRRTPSPCGRPHGVWPPASSTWYFSPPRFRYRTWRRWRASRAARTPCWLGCDAASLGRSGPPRRKRWRNSAVHPAFEPSHPKMGVLVLEAAQRVVGKSSPQRRRDAE